MGSTEWAGRGLRLAARSRRILPILIGFLCLYWLDDRLDALDAGALLTALRQFTFLQWGAALAATAASFLAVSQYDVLFHRWLNTGVPTARAASAGASSVAISQTLGFGLLTGTVSRWRAFPELPVGRAVAITQYVSFSFMAALGLLCCLVLFVAPIEATPAAWGYAAGALALTLGAVCLSLLRPGILPFHVPPLALMARLAMWMTVDVLFAAIALFALLPPDLGIPFGAVFPAFALALSAGLISGSPGGVGPFELCLIALLPVVPEPSLIAAVLGFRLVYYAVPACLGALYLLSDKPEQVERVALPGKPVTRAEAAGLSTLPGHEILVCSSRALHVDRTSQCLVAIGEPASGGRLTDDCLQAFENKCRSRECIPALYKTSARGAAMARRGKWSTLRVSDEAFLLPESFTTDGPAFRQLRRKLKRAEASGIVVERASRLPIPAMKAVAAGWAARNCGERGFSMGRFDPDQIASQVSFLAWREGELVAFATFHANDHEWCLDLMRNSDDAGDGTMHALIVAAIRAAKDAHIPRLSLAAMPLENPGWLLRAVNGSDGLRRFKMSFAPRTQPLYLAAPGPCQLMLAGLDILLRIRFPDSLAPSRPRRALRGLQGRVSDMLVVPEARHAHVLKQREKHSYHG